METLCLLDWILVIDIFIYDICDKLCQNKACESIESFLIYIYKSGIPRKLSPSTITTYSFGTKRSFAYHNIVNQRKICMIYHSIINL